MKTLNVIGLGLLLGATAFAAQGVMFKFTPKKGEVTKYKATGKISMMGTDVEVTMITSEKVLEVMEDGSYKVEQAMIEGKAIFGGQEMDIPAGNPSMSKYASNGQLLEVRGEAESTNARVSALQVFLLPEKAVAVGEKWTVTVPANTELGTMKVTGNFTFVGDEKVLGRDCYKITQKIGEVEGSDPAAISGTAWYEKSSMKLIKADMKWENVPMPAAPAPISGNFMLAVID